MEDLRQKEANMTALLAIGPRKKPRLDGPLSDGSMAAPVSTLRYLNFVFLKFQFCV